KRFQVLSTLPAKAVSEISSRYGKVSRSMSAVNANLAGSRPKPGAKSHTSHGAANIARAVIRASTAKRLPATASSNSRISRLLPRVAYSESTGMKAWLKAPSANNRRMKLGILKATKKASAPLPAPNRVATTTSRTSPMTRDNMVMALTTTPERIKPPVLGATARASSPCGGTGVLVVSGSCSGLLTFTLPEKAVDRRQADRRKKTGRSRFFGHAQHRALHPG